MTDSNMEPLDRHALVLSIWLSFGFAAAVFFRTAVGQVNWLFDVPAFAMIVAAFVGHVIVNAVTATSFTPKEVALGLAFYGAGLIALTVASLLSPAFATQQFLPCSLGFIAVFASVVFYMITRYGLRRAFESFDVIRQFRQ